ncbi:MAG: HAMP domain-containing histidine kinase [Blautia sp.]|nr:HAMP domain-containing histidine kinase [Lachnoclostridium sp.]MCM1210126.1 HAMP domain-containing histidine kinase [Blautia sp.]
MLLPWILCGILSAIIAALCLKLYLVKKSIKEICTEFMEHLETDTNTLISISSNDRHVRYLAASLNSQLRLLRSQRQRYLNGDRELKNAVTNISHDLRTPLTAICGYLDLLENEDMSEDAARYLGFIENRIHAMKQLTEELFRYSVVISNIETMSFEKVNINSVLEESIATFYAVFMERGITPTICLPEKKIVRTLNKAALSRIFGNLLSNALKYSDGDLDITLRENGEILFTNTAAGLNEVQVGRLFDRFFSVEAAGNSTGLGLAIAKALTEQMHGTIGARYEEGRLEVSVRF